MSSEEGTIRPLGRPGDLGWVVMTHGEVYAQEFGWDASFEALVAGIVADYAARRDASREAAWIAEVAGRRVGCIFCVADPERAATALLRILLVHPDGRGRDLGRRLLDVCLEYARGSGYERVRLWTNHPLAAARHLYLERGFRLLDEAPHHSFGAELIGQTYELDLRPAIRRRRQAPPTNPITCADTPGGGHGAAASASTPSSSPRR